MTNKSFLSKPDMLAQQLHSQLFLRPDRPSCLLHFDPFRSVSSALWMSSGFKSWSICDKTRDIHFPAETVSGLCCSPWLLLYFKWFLFFHRANHSVVALSSGQPRYVRVVSDFPKISASRRWLVSGLRPIEELDFLLESRFEIVSEGLICSFFSTRIRSINCAF